MLRSTIARTPRKSFEIGNVATLGSGMRNDMTIAKPTGAVAGDLLILLGTIQGSSGLTHPDWTLLSSQYATAVTSPCQLVARTRRLTAADAATTQWTFDHTNGLNSCGVLLQIRRLTGRAPRARLVSGAAGYPGAAVAPSLDAVARDRLLVCGASHTTRFSDSGTASLGLPTGMTSRAQLNGRAALRLATLAVTAAGATGAKSFSTSGGDAWGALSLLID